VPVLYPYTGMIVLRDYQEACLDHIFKYFETNSGNPIAALPTGTGKSVIIGEFIKRACIGYPNTRVLMLTHVKELIGQNLKALLEVWPTAPAGVYSAGLKRKEHRPPVIMAGIQSVHRKSDIFGRVDLVLIDECHLVNPKNTTMYQKFLDGLRDINPKLKVIGFSATPFRLGQGMLTDADALFTDICFDLTSRDAFNWLIAQGWISRLIPKQPQMQLDITGVKISGGEFVLSDLQDKVDREAITIAALKETVALAADRKHWLIFASGIEHAKHIAEFLESHFGITAAAVHSQLTDEERDRYLKDFRSGKIQAIVNNNILTTGFDFPEIDCIVMLRPTASPGLWVQMLGRGTRPALGKENCLVLDFAGNTKRLGPINDPVLPKPRGKGPPGPPPVRLCEHCGCYSHASCRFCENPECGLEFPRNVKIAAGASTAELIAGIIPLRETFKVSTVSYRVHKKEGRPDSMRVDYYCGLRRFSEYIALDHGGYAGRLARQWWEQRSPYGIPPSVHDGMKAINDLRVPTHIEVSMRTKYPDIVGYTFGDE
jgi:DNA repair protein RadD